MNVARAWALLRKDLRLGPRSPVFLWAVALPVVMTLLVQGIFGSLFQPVPRLGVVDLGASQVTAALLERDGLDVRVLQDASELKRQVEAHDLDGGLVLAEGFDDAVRAGERPLLEIYMSGESLASNRVVMAVTAIDLVRQVEGRAPPVEIELVRVGGDALPMSDRLVPLLVLMTLIIAGVFVTSFSLVEERERDTLDAMLVTPMRLSEVVLAKGLLGLVLALAMSLVTLALNGVLGGASGPLLAALLVGAVMSVEIGLLYGTVASQAQTLFTLFKSLNLVIMAPVVFYLFPNWPQWIAKVFPTYWFLDPVFRISVLGAPFSDVSGDLLVAVVICVALAPVLWVLMQRMGRQLALD